MRRDFAVGTAGFDTGLGIGRLDSVGTATEEKCTGLHRTQ